MYLRRHQFSEGDAFVGFQSDTVSSVVLHVAELHVNGHLPCETVSLFFLCWWDSNIDFSVVISKMEDSYKFFLLQLASHDAIARLSLSSLGEDTEECEVACKTYFEKQSHSSLSSFLHSYIHSKDSTESECLVDRKGSLFQVSDPRNLIVIWYFGGWGLLYSIQVLL